MTQNQYQVSISEVFLQVSWSGGFRTGRPRRFGAVLSRKTTIRCLFRRFFFQHVPRGGAGGAPGETPLRFVGLDPTAVHPTHAMAPRGWRPRGAGLGPRSSPIGAPSPSPRHPATLPSRSVNN